MDTVYLSDNAFRDVALELADHPTTETGGILLGEGTDKGWFVVEVLDPGPRTIRSAAYFEYNHTYATHLAHKVARRYQSPLRLLGLWHRHPGSLDEFSRTDDETHVEYLRLLRAPFVSMLVNVDPDFRMTFYRVEPTSRWPRYVRVECAIGDEHFPPAMLRRRDAAALVTGLRRPTSRDRTVPEPARLSDVAAPRYAAFHAEGQAAPKRAASPEQSALLDLLDAEFDYLDSSALPYQVTPQEQGFHLAVSAAREPYPPFVEFSFYYRGDVAVVAIDGTERPYNPGVVQQFYHQFDVPPPQPPAQEPVHEGPPSPPDRPDQ